MEKPVPARLSAREGRKFGLTVGLAFVALGGVTWWRGREIPSLVFWTVGGLLIAAGLIIPSRLGPVERGWMAMAHSISRFTTPVFMGLVYFAVISPIGLLMRLFGHNPLTAHARDDSLWVARREEPRSDLERQF